MAVPHIPYSGKVWQVKSLMNLVNCLKFAKLKPSKVVVTINNPSADLFICQTSSHQTLEKSKFAKQSPRQTFLPYGNPRPNVMKFKTGPPFKTTVNYYITKYCIYLNRSRAHINVWAQINTGVQEIHHTYIEM